MRSKHLEGDCYGNLGCMLVSCLALSPHLEYNLVRVFLVLTSFENELELSRLGVLVSHIGTTKDLMLSQILQKMILIIDSSCGSGPEKSVLVLFLFLLQ